MSFRHGIGRARDGSYEVRLPAEERMLLASLPGQLSGLLGTGSPSVRRLFPPAYEDVQEDEEYRRLVQESLLDGRRAALRVLETTATAERLTAEELEGWLGALESLRLVLGTELDVTEDDAARLDPDDPDAPRRALYHWLSWLQDEAVQALAGSLPAGSDLEP
ncbi:MAG TPA: DUF2017 family protein [Gaiella sp.]|jgi:hypothetical protein